MVLFGSLSKKFNNGLKNRLYKCSSRGGGNQSAYTLAEVVIVMLVVAVVVSVSIKITKTKLDRIVSYTYYSAYSTVRNVTGQILADFSVKEDKKYLELPDGTLSFLNNLFVQKAYAKDCFYGYQGHNYSTGQDGYHCYNYTLGSACGAKTWNCNNYVGKYGITQDMCNTTKLKAYLYWLAKGKYSSNNVNNVLVKAYPDIKNKSFACYSGVTCGVSWGNGYWDDKPEQILMGCTPGYNTNDMSHVCDMGIEYFFVPTYEFIPDEPEPEPEPEPDPTPTPNVCANQPTDAEIETKHCQGWNWNGYPTCQYERIVCPDGQHFSENACGCVPESATLPRKGQNFCEKFVEYSNTKSNSPECNGDKVTDTSKSFSEYEPDIILRNGMRLYNVRQNPDDIDVLQNNTQGASYEGVPNVNTYGYTIYIDIDGEKGASTLWEDVYPFYITMSGKVIPAYDTTAGAEEIGGSSARHLMVSVQQEIVSGGARKIIWHKKSVSYKDGACASNYISPATPYCSGVNLIPQCNDTINVCVLKYIAPVKFFD